MANDNQYAALFADLPEQKTKPGPVSDLGALFADLPVEKEDVGLGEAFLRNLGTSGYDAVLGTMAMPVGGALGLTQGAANLFREEDDTALTDWYFRNVVDRLKGWQDNLELQPNEEYTTAGQVGTIAGQITGLIGAMLAGNKLAAGKRGLQQASSLIERLGKELPGATLGAEILSGNRAAQVLENGGTAEEAVDVYTQTLPVNLIGLGVPGAVPGKILKRVATGGAINLLGGEVEYQVAQRASDNVPERSAQERVTEFGIGSILSALLGSRGGRAVSQAELRRVLDQVRTETSSVAKPKPATETSSATTKPPVSPNRASALFEDLPTVETPDRFAATRLDEDVATAKLTPEQRQAVEPVYQQAYAPRDAVTGFHESRIQIPEKAGQKAELVADSEANPSARVRTLKRAQEYAQDNPGRAFYIEADIINLGGLNAAKGHTGANTVYRELAQITNKTLKAAGGNVIAFRHGVDEFSFVVSGVDKATLEAAMQQAKQQLKRYTEQAGLNNITHTKTNKADGVGVTTGIAEITPDESIDTILSRADQDVELEKRGYHVNPNTIDTAGTGSRAGEQTGAAGQGAAATERNAPGFGDGLQQPDAGQAQQRAAVPRTEQGIEPLPEGLQAAVDDQARLSSTPKPKPVKRSTRRVQPQHDSLLEALSKLTNHQGERGLSRDAAEADGIDPAAFNRLGHAINRVFTRDGMSMDEAAELLDGLGYPVRNEDGNYDPNVLTDLIGQELAGNEVYSLARSAEDDLERQFLNHMETYYAEPVARSVSEDEALEIAGEAPVPDDVPQLLADEEYRADTLDGETIQLSDEAKTLADLELLARRYNPDAAEDALNSASPATAARKLWQIIQRGKTDEQATQTRSQINERDGTGAYLAREPQETGPANREEADLLGNNTRNQQALTDEARRRDQQRNTGQQSVETGDPDDLFSQAKNQGQLFDRNENDTKSQTAIPARESATDEAGRGENAVSRQGEEAAQLELILPESSPVNAGSLRPILNRNVALTPTGSARGPAVIASTDDVATIGHAYLRNSPQEQYLSIVADADGRVLAVIRHHIGSIDGAHVDISLVAGAAADVPGAAQVWAMHNHPSGTASLSRADRQLSQQFNRLLRDTGLEYRGIYAVTPDGRYGTDTHEIGILGDEQQTLSPDREVTKTDIPRLEREFTAFQQGGEDIKINAPEKAIALRLSDKYADETGVLLLDVRGRPVGFVPMTSDQMANLRDNGSPLARELLRAIHRTNTDAMMAFVDGVNFRGMDAPVNISRFGNAASVRVLDAITKDGVSMADKGHYPVGESNYHSRGGVNMGQTVDSLRASLRQAIGANRFDTLERAGLIQLMETPEGLRGGSRSEVPGNVRGAFNGKRVALVTGNIPDGKSLGVFLHEAGGHAGLRAMLGEERYGQLVQRFKELLEAGDKAAARAVMRAPNDTPADRVDEERLAYLIEDVVNTSANKRDTTFGKKVVSLVRQAVNAIRAWFYASPFYKAAERAGVKMKLSPEDIAALARRAASRWMDDALRQEAAAHYDAPDVVPERSSVFEPASRFSRSDKTREAYQQRIDELLTGAKPNLRGVRVLDRSDILDMLGYGPDAVHLQEGKVKEGMYQHHLTAEDWKKVPEWLENPIAVFDSETVSGRLVFLAPETKNGYPILAVVEPLGDTADLHLLVNAYDKDSGRMPIRRWLDEGLLRYVDKKTAPGWLSRSGLQLPGLLNPTRGLTDKVYTNNDLVKYRAQRAEPPPERFSRAPESGMDEDLAPDPPAREPRSFKQWFKDTYDEDISATGVFKNRWDMLEHGTKAVLGHDVLKRAGMELADTAPKEFKRMLRQYRTTVFKSDELAKEVAKAGQALTVEQRRMVSDYMEQMLKSGDVPPEAVVETATTLQAALKVQADEAVDLGMLPAQARDRWEGRYLPRFYAKHELGDNALNKALRTQYKKIDGTHLKGRGIHQRVPVNRLDQYRALGWELRDVEQGQLEGMQPADTVLVWRDYTPKERANMGEIRDGIYRFTRGYMTMQRDLALGRLFRDVAASDVARNVKPAEGWIQVPETAIEGTGGLKRFGLLAGKWVPADVWHHLRAIRGTDNAMARAYLRGLSLWKEGKTAMNPVVHGNNVVSSWVAADLAGVGLHRVDKYVRTFREYRNKGPIYQGAVDAGLLGGGFYGNEIGELMPSLDELKAGHDAALGGVLTRLFKKLGGVTGASKYREVMGRAYQAEDQFFKLLLYMDGVERGKSSEEAVEYANRFIFDYSDIPEGVRKIKATILPFFSYTYKAIPALSYVAMHAPWRFAKWAAIFGGANWAAYQALFGDEADEQEAYERAVLPEYMQGGTALPGVPKSMRMPYNDEAGRAVYLDLSRRMPLGDLFDAHNQLGGLPLPAPLTPNNPVLGILAGMIWNKDTFTGRKIVEDSDTAWEAAQQRSGWLYRQLVPNSPLMPGSYSWDKVMNGIASATGENIDVGITEYTGKDYYGRETGLGQALADTLTGTKLRRVDTDLQYFYKINDLVKQRRNVIGEMYSVGGDQGISDENRKVRMAELREKIDAINEQIRTISELR